MEIIYSQLFQYISFQTPDPSMASTSNHPEVVTAEQTSNTNGALPTATGQPAPKAKGRPKKGSDGKETNIEAYSF